MIKIRNTLITGLLTFLIFPLINNTPEETQFLNAKVKTNDEGNLVKEDGSILTPEDFLNLLDDRTLIICTKSNGESHYMYISKGESLKSDTPSKQKHPDESYPLPETHNHDSDLTTKVGTIHHDSSDGTSDYERIEDVRHSAQSAEQ